MNLSRRAMNRTPILDTALLVSVEQEVVVDSAGNLRDGPLARLRFRPLFHKQRQHYVAGVVGERENAYVVDGSADGTSLVSDRRSRWKHALDAGVASLTTVQNVEQQVRRFRMVE